MLLPDKDGFYECDDCDFETDDIFKLFDHCMIKFTFSLRLSRSHILDIFSLLKGINECLDEGDYHNARELVQMSTLTLANAGEGREEFAKFIGEAFIKEDADNLIRELEDMLRKGDNKDDE
jgi:hypothetical protein